MATITKITQIFKDFDLAFSAHPNTKDLVKKRDDDAVRQSIKNLILTNYYERPFHSEIGSPVRSLLFELSTPLTAHTMRRGILDVIENFEPRVRIENIDVSLNDDNNSCDISIEYTVIGLQTISKIDITLERTR
jgi:phage baseplate assembly protein W